MIRWIVLALCLSATPSLAAAQAAEAPTYKIGDEWRYERFTARVVAVEPGQYTFLMTGIARCPECRYTWDSNRTLLNVVDQEGKPADDATVGLKHMQFPMRVGVTWAANLVLRSVNTRDLIPYENTFTVVAYEDVTTKAGTFKAYKIRWEQENNRPSRPWKGHLFRWYSPDVKNWVKQEVRTDKWLSDFELQSYSLK